MLLLLPARPESDTKVEKRFLQKLQHVQNSGFRSRRRKKDPTWRLPGRARHHATSTAPCRQRHSSCRACLTPTPATHQDTVRATRSSGSHLLSAPPKKPDSKFHSKDTNLCYSSDHLRLILSTESESLNRINSYVKTHGTHLSPLSYRYRSQCHIHSHSRCRSHSRCHHDRGRRDSAPQM